MFGRNPRPTNPPRQPPPPQSAGSYGRIPPSESDASGPPPSYGRPLSGSRRPGYDGAPPEKHEFSRAQPEAARMSGGARAGSGGPEWQLRPAKSPADQFTFGNLYETPQLRKRTRDCSSTCHSESPCPVSISPVRGMAQIFTLFSTMRTF